MRLKMLLSYDQRSNILIYSADEKYKHLRDLFKQTTTEVSVISKLEVMGYYNTNLI